MTFGGLTLIVHYEDGSEQQVTADMRDTIRWERDEQISFRDALERMPNALWYALAFYALRRQGEIDDKIKRDKWESGVVLVRFEGGTDAPVTVNVDTGGADPGKPEAHEGPRSSSRSARARVSGKSASTGRTGTARR